MPKINVYLPDELADAVKELSIPVSAVCQHALQQTVQRVTAIRETARLDLDLGDSLDRLTQFTARARTAVRLGVDRARAAGATEIATEHLLGGLLDEGANLGLQILRALDIDPAEVERRLAGPASAVGGVSGAEPPAGVPPAADSAPAGTSTADAPVARRADGPAAHALELTATEALALGHNYIGCEHLVLGLIAEPDGAAGQLLRSLGAEPRLARRAVTAALSGYLHAQARLRRPEPEQPAAMLQQALHPIVERLDRLETRLDTLAADGPA
jgi:Clp amino terminal domain, pathogenicity island component